MKNARSKTRATLRASSILVGCAPLLFLLGCEEKSVEAQCASSEEYFRHTAWPEVFGKTCIGCHSPGGEAARKGAKLELMPAGYPGFLETNLARIREYSKMTYSGTPVILLKPLGELDHGGKEVFKKGKEDPGYAILSELVGGLGGSECDIAAVEPVFADVKTLSATKTFRKAALALGFRLPTNEENAKLEEDGDNALDSLLDGLVHEEAFYTRLKDIFNDRLLTDRYLNYTGYAVNQLNEEMYPLSGEPWDEETDEARRGAINRALAREPLELVSFIVRNDRPFTEYVTADYTVVNPFSAPYYNSDATFSDPANEDEWVQSRRRAFIDGELADTPHAGVLTSPMWLNRYPTTPTNRNRHRARMILEQFLATDILKVGQRPLDPTAAVLYANPTRDDPSCAACHKVIDPLAGTFLKYDDYDPERYRPDREWHNDMEPPGFSRATMTVEQFAEAPEWTAGLIAKDVRFPLAIVRTVYTGLFGRKALDYPANPSEKNHAEALAAWEYEDAIFRAIGEKFKREKFNLRVVVKELVLSPLFRSERADGKLDEERAKELIGLGTANLSTPLLLSRKIEAITGRQWKHGWDTREWLTAEYKMLYGGIDCETVNERLSAPNGVMANVQFRMANEVACENTAVDFNRPKGERFLFPEVEITDLPQTETGDPVPAAEERIRKNIVHLYSRVLGESVKPDSAEVDRVYALFLETWKEGQTLLENKTVNPWLIWQCQARVDLVTGEDLPDEARLDDDPDYTIRAWMAVLTYFFGDYQFLYE